jgi:hypothetical protein
MESLIIKLVAFFQTVLRQGAWEYKWPEKIRIRHAHSSAFGFLRIGWFMVARFLPTK